MGLWLNVAFVATEDRAWLEAELEAIALAHGRRRITPQPRKPAQWDPMHYGHGSEVARWGFAGFAGAPGWTVLRTAPFELLHEDDEPILGELARRLGVAAFQYNIYDGDSDVLVEADATGRVERSGYVGSEGPDQGLPPDRYEVRFRLIDLVPAAEAYRRAHPEVRVPGISMRMLQVPTNDPQRELAAYLMKRHAELSSWLDRVGGTLSTAPGGSWLYHVHPADVVEALTGDHSFVSLESVIADSVRLVFGGANAEHCENSFLVETLVPHNRLPVEGFTLYAER